MTSSDAPALLNDHNPHANGSNGSFSRRDLLARMRPQVNGEQATPSKGEQTGEPAAPSTDEPASKPPAKPTPTPLSQPRILDATEACLREFGYDGTTIRRIAGRLECAVGTIYRHFTDKRTLLDGVTQRRFEPVAELVEQGADVQETAALYLRTAAEEPQQYRLMFWLASVGDHDKPGVPAVVQRILHGWASQLGDASRAQRFWAQLHGSLMLGLTADAAAQLNGSDLSVPSAGSANGEAGNGARTLSTEDMTLL